MNGDTEKRVREAYRQAGRRWPTGPVVMQEPPAPPAEDTMPVFGPGPETPVDRVVSPLPPPDRGLLRSMGPVGVGVLLGSGATLVALLIRSKM